MSKRRRIVLRYVGCWYRYEVQRRVLFWWIRVERFDTEKQAREFLAKEESVVFDEGKEGE